MGNPRSKGQKRPQERDAGGFVALPWSVLDSASWGRLSHPARSLLMEIARQYVRDNNGRLLASAAYLGPRGWKSWDVIARAKTELIDAGFIHETVKGHRPNKASWYAVTWHPLDRLPGYDSGATESFKRSAYRDPAPLKNAPLTPSGGAGARPIAPSGGAGDTLPTPPHGAVRHLLRPRSTPSHGDHLDKPSTAVLAA